MERHNMMQDTTKRRRRVSAAMAGSSRFLIISWKMAVTTPKPTEHVSPLARMPMSHLQEGTTKSPQQPLTSSLFYRIDVPRDVRESERAKALFFLPEDGAQHLPYLGRHSHALCNAMCSLATLTATTAHTSSSPSQRAK
jgi:hypothetical protein